MSTPNPLGNSHSTIAISSKTYHIAGILTTVHGLDELPSSCDNVSCLWLLHPRLQTKETMAPVGASVIHDWNMRRKSSGSRKGLIAVAFDQRNHGSRRVDKVANKTWSHGNPNHAQDMFSIFHGTAMDTSLLIDHLSSYILSTPGSLPIAEHFVLGISLGGHSAWQAIFHEQRISAAVVVIGCPDYMRPDTRNNLAYIDIGVMSDRARRSKIQSYTSSNGVNFLGSESFPSSLVTCIQKWDPRGLLFGLNDINPDPPFDEQSRLREVLDRTIKGKSVLVCSGGDDKLVPYYASATFMEFLTKAVTEWYSDGNVYVENNIYDGIGHAYSDGMSVDARRFLCDLMEGKDIRSVEKISKF